MHKLKSKYSFSLLASKAISQSAHLRNKKYIYCYITNWVHSRNSTHEYLSLCSTGKDSQIIKARELAAVGRQY